MKTYYVYWQGPIDSGCIIYHTLLDAIKGWWKLRRIVVGITILKVKEFEDNKDIRK